jgi:diguanylate cyclase (GGDEF)-like protein/PAS domain S-box-containing protein
MLAVAAPDSALMPDLPPALRAKLLYAALCLILTIVMALELIDAHRRATLAAEVRVENTSLLIGEWLRGAFQLSDYLLCDVISQVDPIELQFPHPDPEQQARRTAYLQQKMATLPHLTNLALVNRHGRVTHSASPTLPLGFDASSRPYFMTLRDDPAVETLVSSIFWSPAYGTFQTAQTRRIRNPVGEFVGVAGVNFSLAFFNQWLGRIDVGPHGSVLIIDHQMALLARRPALSNGQIGKIVDEPIVKNLIASDRQALTFAIDSPIDGVHRIFSIRKVEGLPFLLVVGEASEDFLSGWGRKLWIYLVSWTLIMVLGLIALRDYLWIRNHQAIAVAMNQELLAANQQLHVEVTRRVFIEEALRTSEEQYRLLAENARDVIYRISLIPKPHFIYLSPSVTALTGGYTPQDFYADFNLALQCTDPENYPLLATLLNGDTGPVDQVAMRCIRKDGEIRWTEQRSTPVFDAAGQLIAIEGIIRDITERKHLEEQLRELAAVDELTGLANRRSFMESGRQEIERARRYGQPLSLLMIDADHFKIVNDMHGHAVGDETLRQLARMIRETVREVDIPGRLGGEEFAVLLPNTDLDSAAAFAERLRQTIERGSMELGEQIPPITVSIGVTAYHSTLSSFDELLRIADDALYRAKANGRNCVVEKLEVTAI